MKRLTRKENLKADLHGPSHLRAMLASSVLGTDVGKEGVQILIDRLKSADLRTRYLAAHGIYEGKCQEALVPLLDAVFDPANKGKTDTLAFPIKVLDCRNEFIRVFDILFYHTYAAKLAAKTVLEEQEFIVTDEQREEVATKWYGILRDPKECPEFDHARKDIESVLGRFGIPLQDPAA